MEPTIICFWCRQRITPEEVAARQHNHADEREAQQQAAAAAETKLTS